MLGLVANTQEFLPFPQDSAVWYVVNSYYTPYPPYVYYSTDKYEAKGDTIIDNFEYTKFYTGDAFNEVMYYRGAYRVDYDSNKVYFYAGWELSERLAYDYNLLPGDTITISDEDCICIDTGRVVMMNGIAHKSQTMLVPSADDCIQIWIHGIGSLANPLFEPFWGCGSSFESVNNLSCFYYKEDQIYEWTENPYFQGCIGTNVGIEEKQFENFFTIAPNPVYDKSYLLTKTFNNQIFDYQIFDINGNVIQKVSGIYPTDIVIFKRTMPNGIYLLQLFSQNQRQYYNIKFFIK